jgi:hypothetical protein
MEKRKQRDERKEAGRRNKGGYEKNAKERASGNVQTHNRVYEGHPRPQDKINFVKKPKQKRFCEKKN